LTTFKVTSKERLLLKSKCCNYELIVVVDLIQRCPHHHHRLATDLSVLAFQSWCSSSDEYLQFTDVKPSPITLWRYI